MNGAMPAARRIEQWLQSAGYSTQYELRPLSGGDINDISLLSTECGYRFCIKQNDQVPADFFHCEADGLLAIASTRTLRVPRVIAVTDQFIVLEYLQPAKRRLDYWEKLGAGLAVMHRQTHHSFGFHRDNYCGTSPQPNRVTENGHAFFGEQRILYQAGLALRSQRLSARQYQSIENFVHRLTELVPTQPAALLHGDLWAGNIHTDEQGQAALIDPAVYYGWPEADLAMTLLFGGFAESFYQNYLAVNPLLAGWRERAPIYNVYHLLNHLNLFGGSYGQQAMKIINRYTTP